MTCIDRYRSKLISSANHHRAILFNGIDETAIHRYRVAIKRLTALYRFLEQVNPEARSKPLLRPARRLARQLGPIRDCHIILNLLTELGIAQEDNPLRQALHTRIEAQYQAFRQQNPEPGDTVIRLPTLRALGISQAALLRNKPGVLENLLTQIEPADNGSDEEAWHRRRILLKRYHHSLDAFQFCRGHRADDREIEKMKMLEQLLGDWHDRVVAMDTILSLKIARSNEVIRTLEAQAENLLGSARIYLVRFRGVDIGA